MGRKEYDTLACGEARNNGCSCNECSGRLDKPGGAGWGNLGEVAAAPMRTHGQKFSLCLTLPPLSTLYLKAVDDV